MTNILDFPEWPHRVSRSGLHFIHNLPQWNIRNRYICFIDVAAFLMASIVAITLIMDDLGWWPAYGTAVVLFAIVGTAVKLPVFFGSGLYRRYWPHANVNDLLTIIVAVSVSTAILVVLVISVQPALGQQGLVIPRTLPIIDGLLTLMFIFGVRFAIRAHDQWVREFPNHPAEVRIMVAGAGETGRMAVREIRTNPILNMKLVAFIDDDPNKINTYIEGLPVVATVADIPQVVERHDIHQIIVAMPTASLRRQQEINAICEESGIVSYGMPGGYELLAGHKTLSRQPEIDLNLLLGREPVVTDCEEVANALQGQSVLVTGAGGSIGSELCRQLSQFGLQELILLGHGENSIFEIGMELRLTNPDLVIHSLILDIRDQDRVDWAIAKHQPQVIFHAAAHKHVPFMEENIEEAITNNVRGTQNVLRAAERNGVERFILISSDKAVNPSSIMGATKRLAELHVQDAARRTGRAYMAVRFGNVLGSRGSVIRVFQRQIASGGPITITHPDMRRYFMTIPEAVQLVLQTAVLGRGSEVFLLDMGRSMRIVDLANRLLKLCGLEVERDVSIVYTGVRAGEKLDEELFMSSEAHQRSKHDKIFVATRGDAIDTEALEVAVDALVKFARKGQTQNFIEYMQRIIPEYRYTEITSKPVVQAAHV